MWVPRSSAHFLYQAPVAKNSCRTTNRPLVFPDRVNSATHVVASREERCAGESQWELEALFNSQNKSPRKDATATGDLRFGGLEVEIVRSGSKADGKPADPNVR